MSDAAPQEILLSAQHVRLTAGRLVILEDISLTLHRGEIVTLIGPNGSGKTSLLKVLLGLQRSAGTIARKKDLTIGYVPQQFSPDLSLPITVNRFLDLFAEKAAGRAALARVGVDAATGERQLSALSGGEMARVLLARAIAGKPDLLVLDEPLAGVDIAGEAQLYQLIAELRDELSCGILLVSHDLHVVMGQSDRIICLNHHICCEGDAKSVVRDPAFIALFGSRSALALYPHHHDHAHSLSGEPVQQPNHHDHA